MPNQFAEGQPRDIEIQRTRRMMLDPLAHVGIGVLVAVMIGRRQFMMHILRNGKRRQHQEDTDHPQREDQAKQRG